MEFLLSGLVRILEFLAYGNLHFSGVIFHLPFHMIVETEQGIFEQVLHGDLDFSSDPWPSISESAKDIVRKMLIRDPRKRITAHEVLCESFQMC